MSRNRKRTFERSLPDWDEVVEAFCRAGKLFEELATIFRFVGGAGAAKEPESCGKEPAGLHERRTEGRLTAEDRAYLASKGGYWLDDKTFVEESAAAPVPPAAPELRAGDGRRKRTRRKPCADYKHVPVGFMDKRGKAKWRCRKCRKVFGGET